MVSVRPYGPAAAEQSVHQAGNPDGQPAHTTLEPRRPVRFHHQVQMILLNAELENEWEHYCNGIYGICTLNASPREIIEKEIAVKKLIALLNAHRSEELPDQKENLSQIVGDYDRVSNLFAPYQRETSSRGKYVDRALEAAGCEDKIKHYQ